LFSALCGALALAQLARSVALLPHDRTNDQRERINNKHSLLTIPLAWLPPIFAVLVCGLQLSFWEHSTNGTVEMFDLLLFAYVLRSLLEYRVDLREARLCRAAFVFGAGITTNYAMIAFFPLFVGALVWTRQLGFFNLRFVLPARCLGNGGLRRKQSKRHSGDKDDDFLLHSPTKYIAQLRFEHSPVAAEGLECHGLEDKL
jgi:hypothetical protein